MLGIRKEKEFTPVVTTSSISASNNTNKAWNVAAMSGDGSVVYACANNDYIYKSTDGGLSFQPITTLTTNYWKDIGTSTDGLYIAVVTFETTPANYQNAKLFISQNGGITWTEKIGQTRWSSVSVSNNGQKMIASSQDTGSVYISTDYGNTWTLNSALGTGNWIVARVSGDGSLFVVGITSVLKTSSDGITWTDNSLPFSQIDKLVLSTTGQYQLLSIVNGGTPYIYISQNFGTDISTTAVRTGGFGQTSVSLSISSSGQYMTYSIGGNTIGVSSNFGTNFTTNPGSLGSQNWRFSVMSSDGSTQLLGVSNTSIYKSTNYGTTFTALPTGTTSSVSTISYITTEFNRVNLTASKQIK